jgi:hypothetical protein
VASNNLVPVQFTANDIHRVANFQCGGLPYQWPLATWIKEKSLPALESKTRIWLYETEDHCLVGYGSVGTTKWTIADMGEVKILVIPALAVQEIYWCKPAGVPREDQFSYQIIRHLKTQAIVRLKNSPVLKPKLGLFVHPDNEPAKRLYANTGFVEVPGVSLPDPITRADCPAMICDLTKEPS